MRRGQQADLKGEKHYSEADYCCDAHCHDDCVCVIKAGNHSHHVGQAESQNRLKERDTDIFLCTMFFSSLDNSKKTRIFSIQLFCSSVDNCIKIVPNKVNSKCIFKHTV